MTKFYISPEAAKSLGPAIVQELEAMAGILDALEPLSRPSRARVLLMAITTYCPNSFTEQQLQQLLRVACEQAP